MARDPSVLVHALALCESEDVGPRTRIWAFAQVLEGARVGADCKVGGHAFVEGGVVVGDAVTVKNGVQLFSGVTVEDEVFLGPGAVFTNDASPRALPGWTSGGGPWVGAGGVAPAGAPGPALGVGTPARQVGWACRRGRAL